MNTRHTRAVVALVVAIATLATMGFRAPHDNSRGVSILPAETCNVLGSYTAIELLSILDEPCFAGLVDEVESEIDRGWGTTSAEVLVNSVLERSRSTGWQVDLLELSDIEAAEAGLSYDPGIYGRQSLVTEADLAANAFDLSIDYHNPSSPWAESLEVGGAATGSGSGVWSEGFIDYHNPSSPWAEPLHVGASRSVSPVYPAYDYDSDFDLSELFEKESPAVYPAYDYDSDFDLSELFK